MVLGFLSLLKECAVNGLFGSQTRKTYKRTLFILREVLLVKLKTLNLNAFLQTVFNEGSVLYRLSLNRPYEKNQSDTENEAATFI